MYKILSIDGGGIRGVIPAVVLEYLEHVTGKSVSSCFDLVVGTSTGGIIAAGLTVPDSSGKPKYSASDMLEIYTKHGGEIFERSFWRGITSLGGLADEQYSEERLEQLLADYFKDTTLKDCLKPIVLTTYDIERRKPYFFKTRRAKDQPDRNHYLRDATRATSAAPTFFEPEEGIFQEAGFDIREIDDPIYILPLGESKYQPLTPELYQKVQEGAIRF